MTTKGAGSMGLEEDPEALLDLAIGCRDEGRLRDAFRLHKLRMAAEPSLYKTDAIRLLGWDTTSNALQNADSFCGIFKADCDSNSYRSVPGNRVLGKAVRSVFIAQEYSLNAGREMLLGSLGADIGQNRDRIFSGNSFFNHRHEVMERMRDKPTGLDILLRLFLFGLAVDRQVAERAVGREATNSLYEAELLGPSLGLDFDVVAQVQVYPLAFSDFFPPENKSASKKQLFFLTDWPLESFRPTRTAIMPVGYDTLELCALSAGDKISGAVLDVCCGCGVQGLWVQACHEGCSALILVDISPRACHFAIATMAVNGYLEHENIHILQGDLYQAISRSQTLANTKFSRIISNPPFVSLPEEGGALYAGSGDLGLDAVEEIVGISFQYLNDSDGARVLMVTELPNVDQSCRLLQSFLPEPQRQLAAISVAYVNDDVESIHDYCQERVEERGTAADVSEQVRWEQTMARKGIYNRALVLASICRRDDGPLLDLCPYYGKPGRNGKECFDEADEEDAFLTKEGIWFARTSLL